MKIKMIPVVVTTGNGMVKLNRSYKEYEIPLLLNLHGSDNVSIGEWDGEIIEIEVEPDVEYSRILNHYGRRSREDVLNIFPNPMILSQAMKASVAPSAKAKQVQEPASDNAGVVLQDAAPLYPAKKKPRKVRAKKTT